MNKAQLVSQIAYKSKITKKNSEKVLNAYIEIVKETLQKDEKISLVGFGTFMVSQRSATTGVNPKTKEKIKIPPKKVAKLRFSESINSTLNKK